MVIVNTTDSLSKLLPELKKRGNLLYPLSYCDGIPPMHKVSVREVTIDSNPDHGEIYHPKQTPSGMFALTATGLKRLESAAGIDWVSQLCFRKDNGLAQFYCVFNACAKIQDLDGTYRTVTAETTLDYRDGSISIEGLSAGDIKQKRMSIAQRAETAAKNRVRREAIGLKPMYSVAELNRPFIILKLIKDIPQRYDDAVAASLIGVDQVLCGRPGTDEVLELPLPADMVPDEEKVVTKESLVEDINNLYISKLGAPRAADRQPLANLGMDQLQEILKALMEKEDFNGSR